MAIKTRKGIKTNENQMHGTAYAKRCYHLASWPEGWVGSYMHKSSQIAPAFPLTAAAALAAKCAKFLGSAGLADKMLIVYSFKSLNNTRKKLKKSLSSRDH